MFSNDFSSYDVVGFHATSITACEGIETNGFLPNKIFTPHEHNRLIAIAKKQGIDTSWHEQWLTMLSVTFTKEKTDAENHINQGSAGGQGLKTIALILGQISDVIDSADATFVGTLRQKIENIQNADSVIYAVDLSNLSPRLDEDKRQPFYYFRWHPEHPLPLISEISPSRIIEKVTIPVGNSVSV